jgi:uncharacterized protein YfbU (UPF0304 family)
VAGSGRRTILKGKYYDKIERFLLKNQLEILDLLNNNNDNKNIIKALESGYKSDYEEFLNYMEKDFIDTKFVIDVLHMFRIIHYYIDKIHLALMIQI